MIFFSDCHCFCFIFIPLDFKLYRFNTILLFSLAFKCNLADFYRFCFHFIFPPHFTGNLMDYWTIKVRTSEIKTRETNLSPCSQHNFAPLNKKLWAIYVFMTQRDLSACLCRKVKWDLSLSSEILCSNDRFRKKNSREEIDERKKKNWAQFQSYYFAWTICVTSAIYFVNGKKLNEFRLKKN